MNIKHNYFPNLLLNTKRFVFMSGEAPSAPDMSEPAAEQSEEAKKPEVNKDFTITDLALDEVSLDDQLADNHFREITDDIKHYADESRKAIEEYKKIPTADPEWATAELARITTGENAAKIDYQSQWETYNKALDAKREEARAKTMQHLLDEAGEENLTAGAVDSTLTELEAMDPEWYKENGANLATRVDKLLAAQGAITIGEDILKKVNADFNDNSSNHFNDIVGSFNTGTGAYMDEAETEQIANGIALARLINQGEDAYDKYIADCQAQAGGGDSNIYLRNFIDAATPDISQVNQPPKTTSRTRQKDVPIVETAQSKNFKDIVNIFSEPRPNNGRDRVSVYKDRFKVGNIGYAYGSKVEAKIAFKDDPKGLKLYEDYFSKAIRKAHSEGLDLKTILVSPTVYKGNLAKAINELHPKTNLAENIAKNAEFLMDLKGNIETAKEEWQKGLEALGLLPSATLSAIQDAEASHNDVLARLPLVSNLDLPNSKIGVALSETVSSLQARVLLGLKVKALEMRNKAIADIEKSPFYTAIPEWLNKHVNDRTSTEILAKLATLSAGLKALKACDPASASFNGDQLTSVPDAITDAWDALNDLRSTFDSMPQKPTEPEVKKRTPKVTPVGATAETPQAQATTPEQPKPGAEAKATKPKATAVADASAIKTERTVNGEIAPKAATAKEVDVAEVDKKIAKADKNQKGGAPSDVASN